MSILAKIFKKKEKISNIENQEILIQTPIQNKRILIVSDIHFPLNEKEQEMLKENFDICLLLGDIPKDVLQSIDTNNKCKFYGIYGNHDTNDMYNDIKNLKYIHRHCVIEEDETSIIGISGSSKYKKSSSYCMFSQEEILDITKNMRKVDILISHDSPYQIHSTSKNKEGFKGITEYIKKNKPKLHLYGHHHITKAYMIDETLCICNYRLGIIEKNGMYHTI